MNLALSLVKALSLYPLSPAIADGMVKLSYEDLGRRVHSLAASLENKGIRKGQVVAIISPNVHEFLEIYYACAISGIVCNPLNFRLSPGEIALILQDSEAVLLFAHHDFQAQVKQALTQSTKVQSVIWLRQERNLPLAAGDLHYEDWAGSNQPYCYPQVAGDDLAQLYYTSGTTGKPKGVMLTHDNVADHALATIAELTLSARDTWAHIAPMFHLADAWATFAITWAGGKHVFVPYFDAVQALNTIADEKVTISNLIPTMLSALVNQPDLNQYDLSSLRCILSGGAPIAPETVRKIINGFGCDYIQTYGMTETSPYLTLSLLKAHLQTLPEERQLEIKSRTGRPFMTVELKVVRDDGSEVRKDDREVGEIIVKGSTVTPGYCKQPEATALAIKDGWLHTGDLATIDAEGYVNIVDRLKDMIKTGGENVYSTEVEHVLYEYPGVLECAVIGVPDETWGEAVKAVIVARPDCLLDAQAIIDFAKSKLAHFKAPKSIDIVTALPKTGSGKICKKDLKEPYWKGLSRRVH